jgi:hypothetical protein
MELSVDKRLKLDKPLEPIYLSHKPRTIKVVKTALSVATKADEIALETAKTGKVTAVVAVMSIFKKKKYKSRSAILGNERPSHQGAERANFSQEISCKSQNLSLTTRKGRITKKLAPNSKKLELKSTNLVLNKQKYTLRSCRGA